MLSFLARLWDSLTTPKETPLNTVADPETVEEILRNQAQLQRQLMELQFEWGETLDKLTAQASRFSARQKKRSQREIEAMDDGEGGAREVQPILSPEEQAVRAPTPPLTKLQIIQQQVAERRRRGA